MNRVVVIKAAHGLGAHLSPDGRRGGPDPRRRGVVVGFDGRYSSRQFAEDTAAVLAGLGIPAHLFPDPVPTPLCAFATVHLGAAAGVMVTASHNPPEDNGYKVYCAQRRADHPARRPGDRRAHRRRAAASISIARIAPPDAAAPGLRHAVDDSVEAAYLEGIRRAALHPREATPLRIVYTAMHGVGHRLAEPRLPTGRLRRRRRRADADRPRRRLPHRRASRTPRRRARWTASLALAREIKADLILANDPDADRLGAAVLDAATGSYRMLTGNEIGVLLADDALEHADTGGKPEARDHHHRVVDPAVAHGPRPRRRVRRDAHRLQVDRRRGRARARPQARPSSSATRRRSATPSGPLVRDKDGIGAAVAPGRPGPRPQGPRGQTLLDRLDEILVAHGMSHQAQWSVTLSGAEGKTAHRRGHGRPPRRSPRDPRREPGRARRSTCQAGEERAPGGGTKPLSFPRSNVLVFYAEDGARLIVRPSGTEPKIKFYVELVAAVKSAAEVAPARARLDARCGEIKAALNQRLGFA